MIGYTQKKFNNACMNGDKNLVLELLDIPYINSKDDILFLVYKHMQELWYKELIDFGIDHLLLLF